MNIDTGEIRRWDALSAEQQASGKWIKLPPHDGDGYELATDTPHMQHMPRARAEVLAAQQAADRATRDSILGSIPSA